MFSRIKDRNIFVVYACVLLLGIAYGMAIALTPIALYARGFTKEQIGTLAAWFAGGIVALAMPMGIIVKRFTAKRTFAVCLTGYALCVALFPWLETYEAIAATRVVDGAFSVGAWVSSETILLSRSDKKSKAFVMSIYGVAIALGYVIGPICAHYSSHVVAMPTVFLISGILAVMASVIAALVLDADGANTVTEDAKKAASGAGGSLPIFTLLWKIKTSCFGTFAYGYFQSSAVLFLPLYVMETKGVSKDDTILVPAFFAAGMLLFSNVAGRLGDRFGHLLLMRALAFVGMFMVLGFMWLSSWPLMCIAIFGAGCTLASISPVSLALQGVISPPQDYARANALYNSFSAAGMLAGPPVSSAVFQRLGGGAMFTHIAVLWLVFVVFATLFAKDDPAAGASRTLPRPSPQEDI